MIQIASDELHDTVRRFERVRSDLKSQTQMGFGKYSFLTYEQVCLEDQQYVEWILSIDDPSGKLKAFQEYCAERGGVS